MQIHSLSFYVGLYTIFILFVESGDCMGLNKTDRGVSGRSMFRLVRISHQLCTPTPSSSSALGNTTGGCYSRNYCRRINGTIAGTCSRGFGVCCVVQQRCSSRDPVTVNVNGTRLLSPANIQNASICNYQFPKRRNVCQVRLDFRSFVSNHVMFDDAGLPTPDGNCNSDTLNFSGASNTQNMGPLCGDLTGQHVYLEYGSSRDIEMSIYTETALMMARAQGWDIQVTFIKCDSTERAPPGCLQYFTEQTGRVTSFNYNGRQQLNNQDYSACIKAIPGMSRISVSQFSGHENVFVVFSCRK